MGMDTVELIMKVEDHFQIRIPDKEAENIYTIADIYKVVATHISLKHEVSLNKQEIENQVNQIIAEHTGIDFNKITPDKSITDDLSLD